LHEFLCRSTKINNLRPVDELIANQRCCENRLLQLFLNIVIRRGQYSEMSSQLPNLPSPVMRPR
jgi:hypothetical protein